MIIDWKNGLNTRNSAIGIGKCIYDKDLSGGSSGCTLWIGGNGDVTVQAMDGSIGTFKTVPAGTHLPVQVIKVIGEGTTVPAAQITCLY